MEKLQLSVVELLFGVKRFLLLLSQMIEQKSLLSPVRNENFSEIKQSGSRESPQEFGLCFRLKIKSAS